MSSYNAQAFEPMPDVPGERLDFIEGLWALFEPTSSSSFDQLDRFLLRSMLWQQHDLLANGTSKESGAIARRYAELPDVIRRIASEHFLTGISEPNEPTLLTYARSTASPAMAAEMLARAYLLLRAATAFTISNFNDAGVQVGNGNWRPWIDPYAEARGFWDPAAPLQQPADLWEDVKLALADLTSSRSPVPISMNAWMKRVPLGLPTVSEAERIGVWSLGS
ncbi:hypothetical protein [Tardiphaga sp.]|uniref:hypothetical protein n=1 Tax=Tardiphaga sp. TaxID=1926292 RepID=UPI00262D16D6|nr:hypothetical protein [Tardiphaga sp.]